MPVLRWIHANFLALVVLAAIAVSFGASNSESKHRDRTQNAQINVTCKLAAARTATVAAGWRQLAIRVGERGAPGDAESASLYQATSDALVEAIPAPKGLEGSPEMAEIVVFKRDGKTAFKLSPRATALQGAGCMRANP